jgi:hypothetical protein
LISTQGREKMIALLLQLRDGATTDEALQAVYGYNTDGLEDAWRAAIGAQPRAGGMQPTATPTATTIPTYAPVAGIPMAPASPTARPTQPPSPTAIRVAPSATRLRQSATPGATNPPQSVISKDLVNGAGIAAICCLVAVLAIGLPVLMTLRRRRSRRAK